MKVYGQGKGQYETQKFLADNGKEFWGKYLDAIKYFKSRYGDETKVYREPKEDIEEIPTDIRRALGWFTDDKDIQR